MGSNPELENMDLVQNTGNKKSKRSVNSDSGRPQTAPNEMKKGAKGAKIVEPLAIEAGVILLLSSAIDRDSGRR